MIYMEKKIEAYYSKKELLFLTILFIVSFGVVLCTGVLIFLPHYIYSIWANIRDVR